MIKNNPKVIVAMSGGVDSSVTAALLKKQGCEVAGVFMRFWGETQNNANQLDAKRNANMCCSEGAEKAARAVATKLKIPFYVFDFAKEFKKEVVDNFLKETAAGRTPNPCVVCNKKIKFGLMFRKALALGADFLATGHYARKNDAHQLFAAKDKTKDQSYFLYNLNQRQLSRILLPLADYTKNEVYQMAKKWRLPYRKEESFDLCFVANDAESFVRRHLKLKPGKISDLDNMVLGEHQGLPLYTIGQRKSISVPQGPWWVVKKDERQNILYVSNNEKDLYSRELVAGSLNWLTGQSPRLPLKVWAKIRYKSEAAEATINLETKTKTKNQKLITVIFKKPQRAITPGQGVVFYAKSGEVLGGGMIV